MMSRFWISGLLTTAIMLLAGCVALEIGGANGPDQATVEKLHDQVPTYDDAQLAAKSDYIRAGSVEAYLCRKSLLANLTDDEVLTVLRQKAHEAGANGLTDVSCGPGPVSEFGGCMASIACSATIVKIVESGPSPK
jgi:hypothetical protein